MTVMVALLRGINVGGSGKLAMSQLREVAESIGLLQVRTYIQSGNLVFVDTRRQPDAIAAELRTAIAAATDVDPEVAVRSRDELARVVESNPFLRRGEDVSHLHVRFFGEEAGPLLAGLDLEGLLPEEATPIGRELHVLLPNGAGRSKLAVVVDRHLGRVGTMRNWRTVTTLLAMADEISLRADRRTAAGRPPAPPRNRAPRGAPPQGPATPAAPCGSLRRRGR